MSYKFHDYSVEALGNNRGRVSCSPILVLLWYALAHNLNTIQAPYTFPDNSPSVLEITNHLPLTLSSRRDPNTVLLCTPRYLASLRLWHVLIRLWADRARFVLQ